MIRGYVGLEDGQEVVGDVEVTAGARYDPTVMMCFTSLGEGLLLKNQFRGAKCIVICGNFFLD